MKDIRTPVHHFYTSNTASKDGIPVSSSSRHGTRAESRLPALFHEEQGAPTTPLGERSHGVQQQGGQNRNE